MSERQQEWLILHIAPAKTVLEEITGKLRRTVYDRIRFDFNTMKKDRCERQQCVCVCV